MKWLALLLFLVPSSARAHVEYVLTDQEFERYSGFDFEFLIEALLDRDALILVVVSLIIAVLAYYFGSRSRLVQEEHEHIIESRKTYEKFFPWMIRLSLGIALIGSGSTGFLITPAFEASPWLADLQIFVGFMILAGFLLAPMIWIAITFFFIALLQSNYAIGNIDYLALALVFLLYADSRPGVDDLLEIPFLSPLKGWREWGPLVLRVGIGVAMIYLALYEKLLNPHTSALVVEQYELMTVVPVSVGAWVAWAGLVELLIGIALLVGFKTRLVSAIAFIVLSFSFFYFGEEVFAHITLFTILSILFVTGDGKTRWVLRR